MAAQRHLLARGERAPDFVLPDTAGQHARFYGFVGGRPAIMLLTGDGTAPDLSTLIKQLTEIDDADLHVVAGSGVAVDVPAYHDRENGLHASYGVTPEQGPHVFVLDPNVRVAAGIGADTAEKMVDAARNAVARLATDQTPSQAPRHAPVLQIPDALDPTLRAELMERCASEGIIETGVETSVDGERVEHTDVRHKLRRDLTVEDPDLMRRLTTHIGRRVMPELNKAFAYRATRFEGFKVGCYEEDSEGFFAPHRDNLSPKTAHRRFALSLNLNDDYEGGELCFPEYGPQLYRPDPGEALVFSGSHLHEVLPVTSGRRFVLLSFLFSQDSDGHHH